MEGIIREQKLMERIIGEQKHCYYWQCIRQVFLLLEMPGGKNENENKEFYIGLHVEIYSLHLATLSELPNT